MTGLPKGWHLCRDCVNRFGRKCRRGEKDDIGPFTVACEWYDSPSFQKELDDFLEETISKANTLRIVSDADNPPRADGEKNE